MFLNKYKKTKDKVDEVVKTPKITGVLYECLHIPTINMNVLEMIQDCL